MVLALEQRKRTALVLEQRKRTALVLGVALLSLALDVRAFRGASARRRLHRVPLVF